MKQSLGKGLQSLIPKKQFKKHSPAENQIETIDWTKSKKESIFNIEIDKIKPNSCQPRREFPKEALKELADSIKEHGVLQPLIVSKIEKPTKRGRQVEYELVTGERRWRAAQIAKLPQVPVIIRDSSAKEKLEIALVENLQREDLNAMEEAAAFKQLQDEFNLRHIDIAQRVGKARVTVTNTLRLLVLPKEAQKAISAGRISEGHGRAILMAKPESQSALFRTIVRNNLSVRQAEEKARKLSLPKKPRTVGPRNPVFIKIEKDLGKALNNRVSIIKRGGKNYLNIEFTKQKELDKIIKHLLKF
ncbi:MAG: ParB/RepB/Spo0J family partition protein [Parcubacteria group bacterium]|nr:ParB/RepB/Spo0J family partition protein [Parcubacteria group bacterium]